MNATYSKEDFSLHSVDLQYNSELWACVSEKPHPLHVVLFRRFGCEHWQESFQVFFQISVELGRATTVYSVVSMQQ